MKLKDIKIDEIIDIAKKAGDAILKIYEKDFDVEYKEDDSPLTQADLASHNIITAELKKYGFPILSEENEEIPYEERREWEMYWLVDPLDGTKEFVKKNGEFTVNIALIDGHSPVLGAVYVPTRNDVYYGKKGEGAYKRTDDNVEKLPIDYDRDIYIVVASRSHYSDETREFVDNLREDHDDLELISAGSSLKFCLVAEGKADVYPRFGPTNEWDTAAAHAVVNQAGKHVIDWETREELKYNKENLLNHWFVVK